MGKGYNNYMCKKPFHPGSKANIKRAWMAEQKTENEKKKQEELKVQYEKEQELYNNRALLSTESKDKLELNFMYQAPPGAKRERQKEDDEPEFKFEWQRKYNAPREDYAKGNADIKDQPFGIPVRNVRCIKCHKWGHINTDKECPLFAQASTSSMPTTSMDPMELMKQMKEDGYGLKENVLGHHLNPAAANQQLIPSDDESDPEMEFLKSLSVSEKKKLLRKLKRLSKKQEKLSKKQERSKKKKSKKSKKSKSKSKSKLKKKKSKKYEESETSEGSGSVSTENTESEISDDSGRNIYLESATSDDSGRDIYLESATSDESGSISESETSEGSGIVSSSDESVEKRRKRKKHSSNKESKKSYLFESSDSELDKPKSSRKSSKRNKNIPKKKCVKSDVSFSKKMYNASSDSEFEKTKSKSSKHSESKKAKVSTKKVLCVSSESDQERSVKRSSKFSSDKKFGNNDKISKDYKRNINVETSKKARTDHRERLSGKSQDEKRSHKYNESKIKHKNDNYEEKQSCRDFKAAKTYKSNDPKHGENEKKVKNYACKYDSLNSSDESNLHKSTHLKRKRDKEYNEPKQQKNDNSLNHKEKTKKKYDDKFTEAESKKGTDSNDEQSFKRKKNEDEMSKSKKKKMSLDVEHKKIDGAESNVSYLKKRDNTDIYEEEKLNTKFKQELNLPKKADEGKVDNDFNSQIKTDVESKQQLDEKHDSSSKNLNLKQKCNSPLHPDGFSHLCPQARVEINYLKTDEEYRGKEHDDFRNLNREKRSPSVKQKYNS